ncbi:hypothetical protein MMC25_003794 [Agyrium rufum]|nr:hypothetical protein [Agyrium rufum]
MALTRFATGNSRPRRAYEPTTTTTTTKTTKRTTKPRTKATTGGRVTKGTTTTGRASATHHKRKPTIKDKVSGAIEKLVGKVEHKPGKKAAGTRRMRGTDGKNARTRKI